MSSGKMLQCYNRSCGQVFDPSQNASESCSHHPGFPVFHDAYKKWSCCEKRTTDFTEFLNIKGCTKSYHSNIKPQEPPKSTPQSKELEEIQPIRPPLLKEAFVRPDAGQPMTRISSTVGASLKPVLDKMKKENLDCVAENDQVVQLNTPCQNKGCRVVYKNEQTNVETCLHHSGVPIFHEGMKYWSCCVKRTTDFNSFLEQIGCSTGKHKWHKDKTTEDNAKCRYDWHQTGSFIVISVYSKCPLPDLSYVEVNPVKLHICITFGEKKSVFDEEIILYGVVNVSESLVTYLGTKVEIKLKKDGPVLCWKNLALERSNPLPGMDYIKLQDIGDK